MSPGQRVCHFPPVGGWWLWPTFRHTESIKETSEMSAPDRACPDYPNECVHPWAHARTYAEVKATQTESAPRADHPHTDPGDGRTECERCGKYVWPAIHSCKGVPVTDRAWSRFEAAKSRNDLDGSTCS